MLSFFIWMDGGHTNQNQYSNQFRGTAHGARMSQGSAELDDTRMVWTLRIFESLTEFFLHPRIIHERNVRMLQLQQEGFKGRRAVKEK